MPVVCLTWYSLTKTDLHFLFYVHFSFSSFPLQYQHYWRFDESAVQSIERNWGYSGTFLELRGKIQVTTLSVPQKKCVTEKQDESTKLYLCTFEAVKNQQHFVTPCSPLIFSGKSVFLNRDLKDCAQIIISSPPACLFAKIPLTLNKRKHTLKKEICSFEK